MKTQSYPENTYQKKKPHKPNRTQKVQKTQKARPKSIPTLNLNYHLDKIQSVLPVRQYRARLRNNRIIFVFVWWKGLSILLNTCNKKTIGYYSKFSDLLKLEAKQLESQKNNNGLDGVYELKSISERRLLLLEKNIEQNKVCCRIWVPWLKHICISLKTDVCVKFHVYWNSSKTR